MSSTAIAVVSDQDGQPNGGFGRRHSQHQQRVDLADQIAEEGREGDKIDVDREQDQLDRHQDDNHILAVEENAEDPDREQDGGDREVVAEADGHSVAPALSKVPGPAGP
jgi:hypothetical protein